MRGARSLVTLACLRTRFPARGRGCRDDARATHILTRLFAFPSRATSVLPVIVHPLRVLPVENQDRTMKLTISLAMLASTSALVDTKGWTRTSRAPPSSGPPLPRVLASIALGSVG